MVPAAMQLSAHLGPSSSALQSQAGVLADWVHLLPVDPVTTRDGRGPYRIGNAAALIAASLQASDGKLPIDENHSTDLAAPSGAPSPARGWIVELQARADGIWGRVEWAESGKQLLAEGAYRAISPVFMHDKAGNITLILRAALTNTPNLRGLTALHAREETMEELLKKLRAALGLKDDADEATALNAVNAAVTAGKRAQDFTALQSSLQSLAKAAGLKDDADVAAVAGVITQLKGWTALQATLKSVAKAVGLKEDADAGAILSAVTALAATGGEKSITALQTELGDVTKQLNALKSDRAKDKAITYVDGEIARGRVGVKPLRDHYIARHATDPEGVEKEIAALPIIGAGGTIIPAAPPANKDGKPVLSAEQATAAKVLGLKPEDYQKTLAAEQAGA
jgi:phage I-like protein